LDHGDEDLYDASYKMDPFDIDTPVDTIQSFASRFTPHSCINKKVCMPKDKWFGLDQKTKDLWDQIDDKYKSVILVVENVLCHSSSDVVTTTNIHTIL
jgi:hypothetical protein